MGVFFSLVFHAPGKVRCIILIASVFLVIIFFFFGVRQMILVVNSSSYFHCCGNTIAKIDLEKVLYVFGRDSFSTVSQIFVLGQLLGQLKCIDQPMKSVHAIWRSWIRLNSLGSNTIYII